MAQGQELHGSGGRIVNTRMTSLDELMPSVLPQVLPCPRSMAMDALQMVAVDFFKETGAWRATFQESVCACETVIALDLPRDALVAQVLALYLDESKVDGSRFQATTREITLKDAPQHGALALVEASLRPVRRATALPEELMEEWGDILSFGVLAKLKSMSGKNIDWSDPNGAATFYQLYMEGVGKAKERQLRRRFGSGVLYVNMGE